LSITNRATVFGRDLDFTKIVIAELGVRQTFGPDMVLDVAAYDKQQPSGIVARLVQLPDPKQPTSTRNVYALGDFWVYGNADLGAVRGVDGRLERRLTSVLSGALAFTYETASSPGADPRSGIGGWVALTLPRGWRSGTRVGALFSQTSAFATFRVTNGRSYNPVVPSVSGYTVDNPGGTLIGLETARLPSSKTLDLRVRRGFQVRGLDAFVFLESTNLLNWTNVRDLFTEVGDVVYSGYQRKYLDEQRGTLRSEASSAGVLRPDSSVDFTALGGCANWQGLNSGNYASGPVDCVLLERAEQRFGNGDGVFTPAEYTAAFTAWYNLANAPYQFYGPGRRIRVGAEFSF